MTAIDDSHYRETQLPHHLGRSTKDSIDVELARIGQRLDEWDRRWENYDKILSEISKDVKDLTLAQARYEGAHEGAQSAMKKVSGIISFIVSTGVVIAALILKACVYG